MIAAAILLSIAGTTFLWSIIVGIVADNRYFLLGIGLLMTVILCFIGTAILITIPTNNDVRNGEAHYIEQNYIEIINGDTINTYKTYQIVWNQNTK